MAPSTPPPALRGGSLIDAHKLMLRAAAEGGDLGAAHVMWSSERRRPSSERTTGSNGSAASSRENNRLASELRVMYRPLRSPEASVTDHAGEVVRLRESEAQLHAQLARVQARLEEALDLAEERTDVMIAAEEEHAAAEAALKHGKAEALLMLERERARSEAAEEAVAEARRSVIEREVTHSAKEAELRRALEDAVLDLRDLQRRCDAALDAKHLAQRIARRALLHAWRRAAALEGRRRRLTAQCEPQGSSRGRGLLLRNCFEQWRRRQDEAHAHEVLLSDARNLHDAATIARHLMRWRWLTALRARLTAVHETGRREQRAQVRCLVSWRTMVKRQHARRQVWARMQRSAQRWVATSLSARRAWQWWRLLWLETRLASASQRQTLALAWNSWLSAWVAGLGHLWKRGCDLRNAALKRHRQATARKALLVALVLPDVATVSKH